MGNDYEWIIQSVYLFHKRSYATESIHIKSAIDFIKENVLWLKKAKLQDLYFSSFSSAKPYIEVTPKKITVYMQLCH